MIFCDTHLHAAEIPSFSKMQNHVFCSCSHTISDFVKMEKLYADFPFVRSFGVHPQNPDSGLIGFLEGLLQENRIDAIGEAGFDLFTQEYRTTIAEQELVWKTQLEFAIKYNKPLIVHSRHALDRLFKDVKALKQVSAVVFHSWPGSPVEANSFLAKGVNAYFSLGKPVLNHNKRALACATELPLERLLLETDAPYQTLKGEDFTVASDIQKVYKKVHDLRNQNTQQNSCSFELFCEQLTQNFFTAFAISADLRKSLLQGHW